MNLLQNFNAPYLSNDPSIIVVTFYDIGKVVPFMELMLAHVSVLTILAISFERYYVITRPLRAGYTCTRVRAFFIILVVWLIGSVSSR